MAGASFAYLHLIDGKNLAGFVHFALDYAQWRWSFPVLLSKGGAPGLAQLRDTLATLQGLGAPPN